MGYYNARIKMPHGKCLFPVGPGCNVVRSATGSGIEEHGTMYGPVGRKVRRLLARRRSDIGIGGRATRSRTLEVTKTAPGSQALHTLLARFTAKPNRSSPSATGSPAASPTRTRSGH